LPKFAKSAASRLARNLLKASKHLSDASPADAELSGESRARKPWFRFETSLKATCAIQSSLQQRLTRRSDSRLPNPFALLGEKDLFVPGLPVEDFERELI
jgi:hypothetical protein